MGIEEGGEPTKERGVFLDEKQKKVKQKMMEDMLEAFFGNIQQNQELFTYQGVMDLSSSVLIMFYREVLVHLFTTMNLTHHRKEIMKAMFESIKDEVNRVIKSKIQ